MRTKSASPVIPSHFHRASDMWKSGHLKRAFRLFLEGAKRGDASSQLNVGYCYDEGVGAKRNEAKALYWYRRAYRRGSASSAANIGLILRGRGETKASLAWLQRALKRGDHDSALEIAKLYLEIHQDPGRAARYLRQAASSKAATEATRIEAGKLLRRTVRAKSRSKARVE